VASRDESVVGAVRRDLERIGKLDARLAESGLAATALALAREIDKSGNSATSKSMCARALGETMDRLRELAPAEAPAASLLDDLEARRKQRRRRAVAS
jgi:hypothetical protein